MNYVARCWRHVRDVVPALVEFFRDDHRDPSLAAEPCGRYAYIMPDDYCVVRRDVAMAIDRAVIISETSLAYSTGERAAVSTMAAYLKTTLKLPVIHG